MIQAVSLEQVKAWLKKNSADEDDFIGFLADVSSQAVQDWLKVPLITKQFVDERYTGAGNSELMLLNFPVYKTANNFTIYDDTSWVFGSTSLLDSDYYRVNSDEGTVTLLNSVFSTGRDAIKVTYWGGLSRFEVIAGVNDKIDLEVSSTAYPTTLTAGVYNHQDLVSHIKTQLEAAGAHGVTFTVSFVWSTLKFKILGDSTFSLKWKTGANMGSSAADLLGYDSTEDDTGTTVYNADKERNGLPRVFDLAFSQLVYDWYHKSGHGSSAQMVKARTSKTGEKIEYKPEDIPAQVQRLISKYKRLDYAGQL